MDYRNVFESDESTVDLTDDITKSDVLTLGILREIVNHPALNDELELPVIFRRVSPFGQGTIGNPGTPVSADITVQNDTGAREFTLAYDVL